MCIQDFAMARRSMTNLYRLGGGNPTTLILPGNPSRLRIVIQTSGDQILMWRGPVQSSANLFLARDTAATEFHRIIRAEDYGDIISGEFRIASDDAGGFGTTVLDVLADQTLDAEIQEEV